MPVRARKLIRKLRGGSQADLVEGEDGSFYVVKLTNNPEHRRTLINEWLAGSLLRHLRIFVPEIRLIELTSEFIAENPEVGGSMGAKQESAFPGIHFGSRLTVHPEHVAIFDFLPKKSLSRVENRIEFLGALVFDRWSGKTDSRQAVFFRKGGLGVKSIPGNQSAQSGMLAQMIDHGSAFGGSHWEFDDAHPNCLYFQFSVYRDVKSLESFAPWLSMVEDFSPEVIYTAWKEMPREWLESDESELESMLACLTNRRSKILDLLSAMRDAHPHAFPNWR